MSNQLQLINNELEGFNSLQHETQEEFIVPQFEESDIVDDFERRSMNKAIK